MLRKPILAPYAQKSMDSIANIDSVDTALESGPPKRWRIGRFLAWMVGALLLLLVIALAVIWWQRVPIATSIVDQELKKLGLPARYEIQKIGPQTQIVRNISVGPAVRPDLTVKSAIVEMRWGWDGPYPVRLVVSGVHLRGAIRNGQISLGSLDKLRDPDSKEPLRLPDIDTNLRDARISLQTDYGLIGVGINGTGNLRDRFAGQAAVLAPGFAVAGCNASAVRLSGYYAVAQQAPEFRGPISIGALNCAKIGAKSGIARGNVSATLASNFADWTLQSDLSAADVAYASNKAAIIIANITGNGDLSRADVEYDLRSSKVRAPQISAGQVLAKGSAALDWSGPQFTWSGDADVTAKRAQLDDSLLRPIRAQKNRNGSLPLDPVIAKAAGALAQAGVAFDAAFPVDFSGQGSKGRILVSEANIKSASGASFSISGGRGIDYALPSGQIAFSGSITAKGGDLPSMQANVQRNPRTGDYSGRAVFAPYAAGGASVAFDPLSFELRGSDIRFATALGFSGPLPGGRIDRAYIPLSGTYGKRSGLVLAGGCTTIRFDSLVLGGVRAGQSTLPLCATAGRPLLQFGANGLAGQANIPNLRWQGKVGTTPLRLTAKSANLDFATLAFSGNGVAVELGDTTSPIAFDIARITGTSAGKGAFSGRIEGAAGKIGAVPLLLSDIGADWSYANGQFGALGALQFEDAEQVDRFKPMISKDFVVNYAGDMITASGGVYEPKSGRSISGMRISHSLSGNSGTADLNVIDLKFDDTLQPEMLSPITLGVIANVRGTINGAGQIRWNNGTVTSDGTFRSDALDLAAAFGPVSGLSGEIVFNDLLGFETAPGQIAKIASINPGQEVVNGLVRYQLLPEQQVAVEGGTWEFAGGQLLLMPTVLDFSAEKPRRFLFAVRGVDAELFLYRFGYENLSATGVFDGDLPMVFDQAGGRIENGMLKVRPGGGTISYIGELSNRDLGFMANFAFEALKSLKFDNLSIVMNGDLGGELVTDVKFTGIGQGQGARRNLITRQIAKLPFEFNISIKAPCRQLLESVRRLSDANVAVEQQIDALIKEEERLKEEESPNGAKTERPDDTAAPEPKGAAPQNAEPDVQPSDSQPKVKGEHEQ